MIISVNDQYDLITSEWPADDARCETDTSLNKIELL